MVGEAHRYSSSERRGRNGTKRGRKGWWTRYRLALGASAWPVFALRLLVWALVTVALVAVALLTWVLTRAECSGRESAPAGAAEARHASQEGAGELRSGVGVDAAKSQRQGEGLKVDDPKVHGLKKNTSMQQSGGESLARARLLPLLASPELPLAAIDWSRLCVDAPSRSPSLERRASTTAQAASTSSQPPQPPQPPQPAPIRPDLPSCEAMADEALRLVQANEGARLQRVRALNVLRHVGLPKHRPWLARAAADDTHHPLERIEMFRALFVLHQRISAKDDAIPRSDADSCALAYRVGRRVSAIARLADLYCAPSLDGTLSEPYIK